MGFKNIIASVAPFIGTMLGGSFGGAAGRLLGRALLGNENATEQEIEDAVGLATPEQLIKLKELDARTKIEYAKIGLDEKKIHAMDRDSARQREIQTGDWAPSALAAIVTLGFFGILGILMFYNIPKDAVQIINIMLGVLGAAWSSVIAYYFGSSSESAKKDQLLNDKHP